MTDNAGAGQRPFLDFYGQHNIIPVSQDITRLAQHFERREALYRHCGLPPSFITGRRVLEIGPGTGHNAIYTNSLRPARYVLLDGNPRSLQETKATLTKHFADLSNCEIVEADFHHYDTKEQFDLVLCEGTLPTQKDPQKSLRQISQLVVPGGILIITCIDSVSWLSELLRLLLSRLVLPHEQIGLSARLDLLRPLFAPHLETLSGRSRPVDDWIIDNLLQPLLGKLLSMEEAIKTLEEDFTVYGSSPHFLLDWRWYKEISGPAANYNLRAREAYHRNIHNLLDYRYLYAEINPEAGLALLAQGNLIYELAQREPQQTRVEIPLLVHHLQELHALIRPLAAPTAEALADYIEALKSYRPGERFDVPRQQFLPWFGRGQQYLSFLRHHPRQETV